MYERSRAVCFPRWEESARLEENGSNIKDDAAFGKWPRAPGWQKPEGRKRSEKQWRVGQIFLKWNLCWAFHCISEYVLSCFCGPWALLGFKIRAITYWGWGPTGHNQWESYLSHCHDLTRNTLRKKGFVWIYSLRRDITYRGRKWRAQWVKELSNHICSQESEGDERWCVAHLLFIQPRAGPVDDTAHIQD